MPRYLSPSSSGKVAIAICGRCKFKFHYNELRRDRNIPGLYVCDDCCDLYDPYRLPARKSEDIALRHPRKDEDLE